MTTIAIAPVRLIMVTGDNNNKFYNMTPDGGEFIAEWGRVGVTSASKRYPMSKWNSTYKDKTTANSKHPIPYKDVTNLVKVSAVKKSGFAGITEPKIDALMTKLQGYSKQSVTDNYTISSTSVTQAQVSEAQGHVDELTNLASVGADHTRLNKLLLELYQVIPRRMKKVQDHLVPTKIVNDKDLQFFRGIVDNEQQTLDVMAGQVSLHVANVTDDATQQTILDALGITINVATDYDIQKIKAAMGPDAQRFRHAFVVSHPASRTKYSNFVNKATNKKTELFWHGSRNENWISILKTGLLIRPSNAIISGAMFGHGIYFADKFKKSFGYTSGRGSYWAGGSQDTAFLSLLDVHVGKQFELMRHSHECYDYNNSVLRKKGDYDSVFAKGGADLINNEFIVYDNSQSTIHYLVEVSS